eukprot:TRINITY_DN774119_c0_g1_i1.p1 TRINITY_DN774119_c0_g1~~TRINITY_DN774119_c0_g1_i1.p1  ORF type:complete len:452 (-),score=136.89 TRINITY_DN774119_c0_g1_i1:15-1370(-)
MADRVQYVLESRTPMLNEWIEREVLTRDEVSDIVKKTMEFESLTCRREPIKADYRRAIEYEYTLHNNIQHILAEKGIEKHTQADFHCLARVHHLFNKFCARFKGDVSVWREYIDFCLETEANTRLNKVWGKVMAYHARVVEFWIKWANWEFKEKNASTARETIMSGLRATKYSLELFPHWFQMELVFAFSEHQNFLEAEERREEDAKELEENEESVDLMPDMDEATLNARKMIFKGEVAKGVINRAIEKYPKNMNLWIQFLAALNQFADIEDDIDGVTLYQNVLSHLEKTLDEQFDKSIVADYKARACLFTPNPESNMIIREKLEEAKADELEPPMKKARFSFRGDDNEKNSQKIKFNIRSDALFSDEACELNDESIKKSCYFFEVAFKSANTDEKKLVFEKYLQLLADLMRIAQEQENSAGILKIIRAKAYRGWCRIIIVKFDFGDYGYE